MDFDKAFEHVVGVEGSYVNHPNDRGGPTKFGITKATLSNHRGHPVTATDVKNMSLDEAKAIYKKGYWDPLKLDQIENGPLKYILFDQGVNFGPSVAAKRIQELVKVPVDGRIGAATIAAINKLDDKKLALDFVKKSQHHYVAIVLRNHSQLVFLKGWLNRTHKLLDQVFAEA